MLGTSYWRVFQWNGFWYALQMAGTLLRSADGLTGFETGPDVLGEPDARHTAVYLKEGYLYIFYTRKGDAPERILMKRVRLVGDWWNWRSEEEAVEVLAPEMDYEGALLPLESSVAGAVHIPVNQLRDPDIFSDEGKLSLLYSVAGESGIAIAKLELEP